MNTKEEETMSQNKEEEELMKLHKEEALPLLKKKEKPYNLIKDANKALTEEHLQTSNATITALISVKWKVCTILNKPSAFNNCNFLNSSLL